MKNGFWLYISLATIACILLIISSYIGWFFFHLNQDISKSGEQWGQLGDFFGGVLNPILTFITIIILIKTSLYQENREKNQRFEDRFYGMINQVKQSFEHLKFRDSSSLELDGSMILKSMEDKFFNQEDTSSLNTSDFKEAIFPVIRQFHILLKILDSEFSKKNINEDLFKDYYLWLINSTDYKILRFIIFSAFYYDTIQASKYITNNTAFINEIKKLGFDKYIESIKKYKHHPEKP